MDEDRQKRLLNSITACPHGVIAWSKEMDNLVETSTNLASVKFKKDNTIEIVTSQRSSIESSKYDVAAMVESCLSLAGAIVTHSEGYPGWRPNINSEILKITQSSYEKLFGKKPDIRAIHAGLECGLIYQKFKGIDMISIGPTIRGAHTPEEKLNIETTLMFWDLLLDILDNIPLKE
jgi:dipeptidase D